MGAAWVENRGVESTTTMDSTKRILRAVDAYHPTHVLVLYGTNDWNSPQCQSAPASACYTIDELRAMIEKIKGRKALTILSTLTPVSVNTGRNQWIEQMNALIKALGHEQGVAVVDAYAAFRSAGNLSSLYYDDVHPERRGLPAPGPDLREGSHDGPQCGSKRLLGRGRSLRLH